MSLLLAKFDLENPPSSSGSGWRSGPLIFFWPHHASCGSLVPQSGIESVLSALEV